LDLAGDGHRRYEVLSRAAHMLGCSEDRHGVDGERRYLEDLAESRYCFHKRGMNQRTPSASTGEFFNTIGAMFDVL
jgi:hypothetical protein